MIAHFFASTTRDVSQHARNYVAGLLSHCPRKNMERLCETLPDAKLEDLQHFLSDSPWATEPVWKWIGQRASATLGEGFGKMLLIDESAFAKKGDKSAGVSRQYNGRLGKVDNCQVGVFAAMSARDRAVLCGARLYLPEEWAKDPLRCEKAGIPESERVFRTKGELAWELIKEAESNGLPFESVGFDAGYGRDQGLLLKICGMGKRFVADVDHDQLVWKEAPIFPRRPEDVRGSGAVGVDTLWKENKGRSRRYVLRDAENGKVEVQFWAKRVWIWPPTSEVSMPVWLLVSQRSDGGLKYSLSNAEEETGWKELAIGQGQRHFVERAFEDGKSQLGMGQYQARKWLAWQHHMVLVGLAMVFALEERELMRQDSALLSVRDIVEMIAWYFTKDRTGNEVEAAIRARHDRRRVSMESHKRRDKRPKSRNSTK